MLTTTRTQSKEKHATNTSTSFKHLLLLLPPLRSVWPDLAKFHHFVKILKVFGNFSTVYFPIFESTLDFLCHWANFHCNEWQKIGKNNFSVWSHCLRWPTTQRTLPFKMLAASVLRKVIWQKCSDSAEGHSS